MILLYSHCISVKGALRAAICDLQRNECWTIPLFAANLIDPYGVVDITKERLDLSTEDKLIINGFVEFLKKHELAFDCDSESIFMFPPLQLDFHLPATISNCVIEVFNELVLTKSNIDQLIKLNCRHFQLIFSSETSKSTIIETIGMLSESGATTVSVAICARGWVTDELLINLTREFKVISNITCFSSTEDRLMSAGIDGMGVVIRIKGSDTSKGCGNIHTSFFSINIETFTESQHHNTCLNRKISIDVDGNIKNCPSMAKSYGNIRDTKLIDVVNNPEFQKVWHIKKDEITKCKDCEFRHVCTDCRAYLDNPDDVYSAPLKCGYNPYNCEWEEWSKNPLKQKAIEFYGMQDLVKRY